MRGKRAIAIASCTGALLAVNVGMATAGEITGNGKVLEVKGKSICAFSGLNDVPDGSDGGAPGRTQNWGQIDKGIRDDVLTPAGAHPGTACNPTTETEPEH